MRKTDDYIHVDGIHTAFTVTREQDFHYPGESHNFWELVYVNGGTVGITAGSIIHKLSAKDIIFHKPNEFHRIWSEDGTTPTYTVISFNLSGERAAKLEQMVFHTGNAERPLIDALLAQIAENGPGLNPYDCSGNTASAFARFAYTLDLFLIECLHHTPNEPRLQNEETVLFETVVKYMEQNLNTNPTNAELARIANVSLSTLKRIFLRYTSLGIHAYFTELKMMQAKSMLRQGLSVREVSEALGFSGQNYFSAAFKRSVGVPPSEYR